MTLITKDGNDSHSNNNSHDDGSDSSDCRSLVLAGFVRAS